MSEETTAPNETPIENRSPIKWEDNGLYILLGFGNGSHIPAILTELPAKAHLIIIEPHTNNTLLGSYVDRMKPKWVRDKRLTMLLGDDKRHLASLVSDIGRRHRLGELFFLHYDESYNNHKEFFDELRAMIVPKAIDFVNIGRYFTDQCLPAYLHNGWQNLSLIAQSVGIEKLVNQCKDIPAIIIASGASLDKNIHLLKDLQDKAVLIACGSAVTPLQLKGITPHIVTALDPFDKNSDEIINADTENIVGVFGWEVPNRLLVNFKGKLIFTRNQDTFMHESISKTIPNQLILTRNVSVSSQAVGIAQVLGCSPVIFVGQDLSFSGTKTHAEGAICGGYSDQTNENFARQDIKGLPVQTSPMLLDLLQFYEMTLPNSPVKVINATEGGLEIKGIEHTTLQDCIDRFMNGALTIREKLLTIAREKVDIPLALSRALGQTKRTLDGFIKKMTKAVANEYCEKDLDRLIKSLAKSDLNHYFGKIIELRIEFLEYGVKYQQAVRFDGLKHIINELNELCRITRDYCIKCMKEIE